MKYTIKALNGKPSVNPVYVYLFQIVSLLEK